MKKDDDLDSLRSDPRFAALTGEAEQLTIEGAWTFSGWALRSKGVADADEAASRFRTYLRSHPRSGRAWYNLGYVQLLGEHEKDAIASFSARSTSATAARRRCTT